MECNLYQKKEGLIVKMELYKDGVKFDAGIVPNICVVCKECVFKMILNMEYNDTSIPGIEYGGGEFDEFMANFFGETLYP